MLKLTCYCNNLYPILYSCCDCEKKIRFLLMLNLVICFLYIQVWFQNRRRIYKHEQHKGGITQERKDRKILGILQQTKVAQSIANLPCSYSQNYPVIPNSAFKRVPESPQFRAMLQPMTGSANPFNPVPGSLQSVITYDMGIHNGGYDSHDTSLSIK